MNETAAAGAADSLGEVERRVLHLMATGLVTDEVADRLDMHPDDVRRHTARVIVELGARSKLEAVVIALRKGLIGLPGARA